MGLVFKGAVSAKLGRDSGCLQVGSTLRCLTLGTWAGGECGLTPLAAQREGLLDPGSKQPPHLVLLQNNHQASGPS